MKDYYAVLGITPSASDREIKHAYRELAKKFHPDKNPDNSEANERFKEVSEAYGVLGSPDNRNEYDYHRSGGSGFSHHASFEDLFSNLGFDPFGRGFPPPHMRSTHAPTVSTISIDLTVDELRTGGKTIPIKIRVKKECRICKGVGGDYSETCNCCGGTGRSWRLQQHGAMVIKTAVPCTLCRGRGKLISGMCRACSGEGKVREVEEYEIAIGVTRK